MIVIKSKKYMGMLSSFLIVTMMIMSCVAANTYEIADTEEGISGSVYDSETMKSFEGVGLLESPEQKGIYKPALIHFADTEKKFCLGDKVYWTFYAYLDGAGSRSSTKTAQSLLYEELETNNVCEVTTVLKDRTTMRTAYHGKSYYTMEDTDYNYKYTSGQHWIIYRTVAPGSYILYISAKCDGPTYKFHFEQLVDWDFVTIEDCADPVPDPVPTCPDDYYICSKNYRTDITYVIENNVCVKKYSTRYITIECKKQYCDLLNKYWYDNKCNDNPQCVPSLTCGNWGACNPDTKSQMRYCHDGCGKTTSQTQDCTIDDPYEPVCGNDICDVDEDYYSCPDDCDKIEPVRECGDDICDPEIGEDYYNCPEDCEEPVPVRECGDKICDPEIGEDYLNCPDDCIEPYRCGDGECNNEETAETCPEDCKDEEYCGDGICNKMTESCDDCPTDCGICPLCLNDKDCTPDDADKCIEYTCHKGSCKEVYLMTKECLPSQWELIWAEYKNWIIGGSVLSIFVIIGIVMLIILGIIYIVTKKKK